MHYLPLTTKALFVTTYYGLKHPQYTIKQIALSVRLPAQKSVVLGIINS